MDKFWHLHSRVYESLRERNVPVDRLVAHLLSLRAFDPVYKDSPKPALQSFFQELRNTESIGTVLFIIRDYFSFFNYRVIKHIVDLVQTRIKLCFTSKCLASLLSGGRVLAAYLPGTLICATGDISTFQ